MGGRALDMSDGWETKRRRGPGNDWVVIRLAARGTVRRVEVDTSNFKGNYPESCSLEVIDAGTGDAPVSGGEPRAGADAGAAGAPADPGMAVEFQNLHQLDEVVVWREALPRTRLLPHWRHRFDAADAGAATHVRFSVYPDGGVARLRVLGTVDQQGAEDLRLRHLNALLDEAATAELLRCCGSAAWAREMAAARPFASLAHLRAAGGEVWARLGRDDWLEAFAAHPRIGERLVPPAAAATAGWAAREQSATRQADPETLAALVEGNRAYEDRFGHRYIVFATGRDAEELLAILSRRLDNPPERELEVAAEEQRKITNLRLEKLLRA
jgi:allantoicase